MRLCQVSRSLCEYCDDPVYWRSIYLEPENKQLWKVQELISIIGRHAVDIHSIHIRGAQDGVIQYILSHCVNLKELIVSGWNTLSDHCLDVPGRLNLRTIKFIAPDSTSYVSIDAHRLGCHVHIHAETLLSELENTSPSLKSITLATKQTWKHEHIVKLIQICRSIEKIQLVPDAAKGFSNTDGFDIWLINKMNELTVGHMSFMSDDNYIILTR
ncbi:uncharacterized protein RHIMIDRAFT_22087 [Rhizopus microsporus ATCC 52813]|uniref:F-box domain-containing protein n=1 Tax=Rhizopus microsporus ATCC 52813 TaxID=1340429 RepID=A0A2G4SR66_RHIZD|nr:uncharacterized protein RHIMIDRAFT_22087 [Rhizopus microsporus ATCC 52813]PHZ11264.1 hypothetical protein RHIMIDRAFT_22087 [Rhizopus microsporus ATCC 52813]